MPAALYPRNRKPEYLTPLGIIPTSRESELKDYLLCAACERLFNENGESEALRAIAPKAPGFPLLEKLRNTPAIASGGGLTDYSTAAIGVDGSHLAYFALSLAWRASVHAWPSPLGEAMPPCDLGSFEEPLRRFLLAEAPFPDDVAVVVIVCTDPTSRPIWNPPAFGEEGAGCWKFHVLIRGVFFVVWLGNIPALTREACCCSSVEKRIFSGDCEVRTRRLLEGLPGIPRLEP